MYQPKPEVDYTAAAITIHVRCLWSTGNIKLMTNRGLHGNKHRSPPALCTKWHRTSHQACTTALVWTNCEDGRWPPASVKPYSTTENCPSTLVRISNLHQTVTPLCVMSSAGSMHRVSASKITIEHTLLTEVEIDRTDVSLHII